MIDETLRPIDALGACGVYSVNNADKLRQFEQRLEAAIDAAGLERDDFVLEVLRLLSDQIIGLELQDNYLTLGPEQTLFRVRNVK